MVTCAGCPYGTFGQRTGIQRSSVVPLYAMNSHDEQLPVIARGVPGAGWLWQRAAYDRLAATTIRKFRATACETAALPQGKRRRRGYYEPYATGAPSSSKKPRVLFGSTGMPGAMVVVKVIFFRYRPLAAAGLSLITSSIAAE